MAPVAPVPYPAPPPQGFAAPGYWSPAYPSAPPEPPAPERPPGFVALDVTFHTQSPNGFTTTVIAPILRAAFPIGRWTVEPDLPLAYYHVSELNFGFFTVPADSGLLVGDPSFAAKYHVMNGGVDFYLGPGIALPLAQIDDSDLSALAKLQGYAAALATRGLWNFWSYLPNALSLFLPIGVRYAERQGLDVGAEAAVFAHFHVGSGTGGDPVAGAQIGAHVGYASSDVETGVWLRGVRLPGESGDDHFQGSFEPYVRLLFDRAFVGAGFLVNIDRPAGPLLDTGSFWGLRFEGGTRF